MPVRFGPLADEQIAQVLTQRGLPASVAAAAQGSLALAFKFADKAVLAAKQDFVRRVWEAVAAPDLTPALAIGESRPSERGALGDQLCFFALDCAEKARAALHTPGDQAERYARSHAVVLRAMRELERMAQPALVLESMILRLRRA